MIDAKWLKQWKSYVGYDSWDNYNAGEESANPGPIDNTPIFEGNCHTICNVTGAILNRLNNDLAIFHRTYPVHNK